MTNTGNASSITLGQPHEAIALKAFLSDVPDDAVIKLDTSDSAHPLLTATWGPA